MAKPKPTDIADPKAQVEILKQLGIRESVSITGLVVLTGYSAMLLGMQLRLMEGEKKVEMYETRIGKSKMWRLTCSST